MKIGIDCRLIGMSVGVGRYVRNLVANLVRIDKKNDYVLFVQSQEEKNWKLETGSWKLINADFRWHSVAEQLMFPRLLNKENLDLMHFPYFSLPILYNRPFVVTIHDLIVNKLNTGRASTLPYPLYMLKRTGYHAVLSNAVKKSKKIIVPSNTVKDDLLNTYVNINSEKIVVTYEGGFDHVPRATRQEPLVKGRYLLRVGNFYPHKNVERLLIAFRDFVYETYENHDVQLVLVGKKDFFFKRVKKYIEDLNIDANIVLLENINDQDLASLYKDAVATIIPSLSEGFSLTAAEAMSCGSPLIVSDIPVHREICGSAAIFCNPVEISDIKQKISFAYSLIDSSREELIKQAKLQSEKFSWKTMAAQTLQIYNSIST